MTIKELIAEYRETKGLSQREFAQKCSLSNGYISMLEKGINPKTNKPITPTLSALIKLSKGMKITLQELFEQVDDILIDSSDVKNLPTAKSSELLDEYIELFLQLSPEQQSLVISMIKAVIAK